MAAVIRNINTILLKTSSGAHHEEGVVDTITYPGESIRLAADGKYDPETLAAGSGLKIVKECALDGRTVSNAYAVGDLCFFYTPLPGDHINALVKIGENIAVGDHLRVEGGGSGKFVEVAAPGGQLEALESSGGALAAAGLIRCRVLRTVALDDAVV